MSLIIYDVKDRIATITLNRPEKLNSYTEEMVGELYDVWQKFAKDDEAWTAIVTGAGDRAFCAGHDLNMIVESKGQYEDHESPTMWYGELEIYKPIIAAVNGYAYGGGCSLALSCDIRIRFGERRFRLSPAQVRRDEPRRSPEDAQDHPARHRHGVHADRQEHPGG